MSYVASKKILPLILVVFVFSLGFYLSSNRINPAEQANLSTENNLSENQTDKIDYSVKQKLADDFEIAFLKQYTPIVGCEDLELEVKTKECIQHLEQAKNNFKQQFIKNRGLPKGTFEDLKLSYTE